MARSRRDRERAAAKRDSGRGQRPEEPVEGKEPFEPLDRKRRPNADAPELEYEHARRGMQQVDPARWEAALEHKRRMDPPPGPAELDPGPEIAGKLGRNGVFVGDRGQTARLRAAKNPSERGSFGFAGPAVEVVSRERELSGTLVLRLDPEASADVHRATIRIFRWDPEREAFDLVRSGVGRGDYLWGRVSAPGVYVPVGVHRNPLVLKTIQVLCSARSILRALEPERREPLKRRICELILCAPDAARVDTDAVWEALGAEFAGDDLPWPGPPPGPPPGGGPGTICDDCLGLELGPAATLPECELLPPGGGFRPCRDPGWRDVGPSNLAGCVLDVVVDPGNSDRVYAATANGGLWVLPSVAAYPGSAWRPLTDQQASLEALAVAVARSDTRVLYLCDGLGYVLRSNDRGATWVRTSSTRVGRARRILVHPGNADTVYVASDAGFWASGDGGATWTRLRAGSMSDAAMDPVDGSVIYLGEAGVGVHKSYSSGLFWQTVLPFSAAATPSSGTIRLSVGRQGTEATRTVVAKLAEEVFVNRSGGRPAGTMGSLGWMTRGKVGGNGYGSWCHVVGVAPGDDDLILAGGQELYRTTDGGATWTPVASYYDPHEDQQGLAFDPANPGVVYLANDGGVWRSTNGGATWHTGNQANDVAARRDLNQELVTAQFYRAGIAANTAVANLYHSGIIACPNLAARRWEGIEGHAWEFANLAGDAKRPTSFYVFHGAFGRRRYPGTGVNDFLGNFGPFLPHGAGDALGVDTRAGSETLLVGAGVPGRIMRTLDARPDAPAWAAVPGIAIGDEPIVSIAMAPSAPGRAFALSSSGRVFRKDDVNDDAVTPAWAQVGVWTPPGGDAARQVAVNAVHGDRVYVISGSAVARSQAGAGTAITGWTPLPGTAPNTLPASEVNSIVAMPGSATTVFVALDVGVFVSYDEGLNWHPFDADLPNAQVLELMWSGGYLYAVTHGRGLWRRRPCP